MRISIVSPDSSFDANLRSIRIFRDPYHMSTPIDLRNPTYSESFFIHVTRRFMDKSVWYHFDRSEIGFSSENGRIWIVCSIPKKRR